MGPLEGIKVLDLTSMVSGPVAAMMLGDQGADVIKVEPVHGEQLRHLGEPFNGVPATWWIPALMFIVMLIDNFYPLKNLIGRS